MDLARVVLDEAALLDGRHELPVQNLAAFLQNLDAVLAGNTPLIYASAVFSMKTQGDVPLLQQLYPSPEHSSQQRDAYRRLLILLSKGRSFENEAAPLQVEPEATPYQSHGLAHVFHENLAERFLVIAAMMTPERAGALGVSDGTTTCPVFFIHSRGDYLAFLRTLPLQQAMPADAFWPACRLLFPNLIIHERAVRQAKSLSQSFRHSLADLIEHLGAINDWFAACHRAGKGDRETIIDLFFQKTKVTISPENPNTHKNKKAMKERTVDLAGRDVLCEWHSKIQPHTDRIYFSIPQGEDGKIVVGSICDHLPT